VSKVPLPMDLAMPTNVGRAAQHIFALGAREQEPLFVSAFRPGDDLARCVYAPG
jgi:hypothetical protein